MNRVLKTSLMTLACVLLTASFAVAQTGERPERGQRGGDRAERGERGERGERPQRERGERAPRGERGPATDRILASGLFEDIELSDSQRQEIQDIQRAAWDERRTWMEENQDKMRNLREKMMQARRDGDQEAANAAREELQELMADAPDPQAALGKVRDVLTADQRDQFDKNQEALEERRREMQERMEERRQQAEERRGEARERRGELRQQEEGRRQRQRDRAD